MSKNFWGDSYDDEPLPDWMNPETYRNPQPKRRYGQSLSEAIESALNKPPVPVVPDREPNV